MYGNLVTRSVRVIFYVFMQPKNGLRWVKDRINRNTAIEQGLPWISYPAIDYLRGFLKPDLKVFEWGIGGSTVFFTTHNCKVTTVESNEIWLNKVQQKLININTRYSPEIFFVPSETQQIESIKEYIAKVKENAPWDIIFVDGLEENYISRLDCIKVAKNLIKHGGILILDDSWRENYSEVPRILNNFRRLEFWGLGVARLGVTKTDVYINEG